MAVATFTPLLTTPGDLAAHYDAPNLGLYDLAVANERRAVLVDEATGSRIVLTGRNFQYSLDKTELLACVVTGMVFEDNGARDFLTIGNVRWKRDAIENILTSFDDEEQISDLLFGGHDVIRGSKADDRLKGESGDDRVDGGRGDDRIRGNTGNDILTGGRGADLFEIYDLTEKDTITDFDAVGGEGRQDVLLVETVPTNIRRKGDNVVMDLFDGDVLVLLDVRLRDFDESDWIHVG